MVGACKTIPHDTMLNRSNFLIISQYLIIHSLQASSKFVISIVVLSFFQYNDDVFQHAYFRN